MRSSSTRYLRIRAVLEEAGYSAKRADEIPTSAVVVEEVCRLLKESDLVVIDSTGDSHSVSYEIGYGHGIGRAPDLPIAPSDTSSASRYRARR